ncbi:uncharacterized protein LOC134842255 [Symsagittifera roscoffensis]|uniref:uncharacterized protein LOC134842255 n=1 Tax=Symsagittifera roscoffensis TaxID=84072 RepID=UPI00307B1974
MSVELSQTDQQEFFQSQNDRATRRDLPASAFQSLERQLTLLASTIIVGPDSIRSGGGRRPTIVNQGLEVAEGEHQNYGMISIEMPPGCSQNKLPPFVRSRADSIANAFKFNYTTQPCMVLGIDQQQEFASRVPKPSREFLKVIDEFRFNQETIEEEEEKERKISLGLM